MIQIIQQWVFSQLYHKFIVFNSSFQSIILVSLIKRDVNLQFTIYKGHEQILIHVSISLLGFLTTIKSRINTAPFLRSFLLKQPRRPPVMNCLRKHSSFLVNIYFSTSILWLPQMQSVFKTMIKYEVEILTTNTLEKNNFPSGLER